MKLSEKQRTRVALLERSARRGQMPPLSRRDEDELYQLLEGEVTFFVGDEIVRAEACDVVIAPAGSPRTFRVESDDARWIVSTRIEALDPYLDFGRAVARPFPELGGGWPSAEELASVSAMAAANGIELLGPPGELPGELQ